jgi:hypothetical protein
VTHKSDGRFEGEIRRPPIFDDNNHREWAVIDLESSAGLKTYEALTKPLDEKFNGTLERVMEEVKTRGWTQINMIPKDGTLVNWIPIYATRIHPCKAGNSAAYTSTALVPSSAAAEGNPYYFLSNIRVFISVVTMRTLNGSRFRTVTSDRISRRYDGLASPNQPIATRLHLQRSRCSLLVPQLL